LSTEAFSGVILTAIFRDGILSNIQYFWFSKISRRCDSGKGKGRIIFVVMMKSSKRGEIREWYLGFLYPKKFF